VSGFAGVRDGLRLARPRQWPVLTAQFAVGAALALPPWPALPLAAAGLAPWTLAGAWLAWVALLNGGTLAYNSAWDRDTEPVAYLRRPPRPPRGLAPASLVAMVAGVALGTVAAGPAFGALTAACVVLSVAYSHPLPRLKGRPGLDLLVNMAGYGAGTTAAGWLAARAALPVGAPAPVVPAALAVLAFALLFGSFYPQTQIYQAETDRARGDRTLAVRLGPRRSLMLSLVLGVAALGALQAALAVAGVSHWRWLPGAALFLWLAHACLWRTRAGTMAVAAHERGMYLALGLWALVDVALVAAWLAPRG
jgi:4-hydroxybenzoate polyprenyltransferase